MNEKRKLKVYESSDNKYVPVPSIILKGKWLCKYGFNINTLISVECDNERIVIEPRKPDNEGNEYIVKFIGGLSKQELKSLERILRNRKK